MISVTHFNHAPYDALNWPNIIICEETTGLFLLLFAFLAHEECDSSQSSKIAKILFTHIVW